MTGHPVATKTPNTYRRGRGEVQVVIENTSVVTVQTTPTIHLIIGINITSTPGKTIVIEGPHRETIDVSGGKFLKNS
jgi:hypothetical protein